VYGAVARGRARPSDARLGKGRQGMAKPAMALCGSAVRGGAGRGSVRQGKAMSLTPPLLGMMQGKKVRPRRERVPAPKELTLHMPVAKLLREYLKPDWIGTHIPSGEKRDIRTATKLKQMWTQPGWPDFLFLSPIGVAHCLELKRIGNDLTASQEDFRTWCIAHRVPYEVCWTMDQVLLAFERWECLRVQFTQRSTDG
jgi:hypothetical protein